jgi:hypothetical protein
VRARRVIVAYRNDHPLCFRCYAALVNRSRDAQLEDLRSRCMTRPN